MINRKNLFKILKYKTSINSNEEVYGIGKSVIGDEVHELFISSSVDG